MEAHYRAMRAHGMRMAADIAQEFAQNDFALAEQMKAQGHDVLAQQYAEKSARGFLISAAIRVKADAEEKGPANAA